MGCIPSKSSPKPVLFRRIGRSEPANGLNSNELEYVRGSIEAQKDKELVDKVLFEVFKRRNIASGTTLRSLKRRLDFCSFFIHDILCLHTRLFFNIREGLTSGFDSNFFKQESMHTDYYNANIQTVQDLYDWVKYIRERERIEHETDPVGTTRRWRQRTCHLSDVEERSLHQRLQNEKDNDLISRLLSRLYSVSNPCATDSLKTIYKKKCRSWFADKRYKNYLHQYNHSLAETLVEHFPFCEFNEEDYKQWITVGDVYAFIASKRTEQWQKAENLSSPSIAVHGEEQVLIPGLSEKASTRLSRHAFEQSSTFSENSSVRSCWSSLSL